MKITFMPFFAFTSLLIYSTLASAEWSPPIQCVVSTINGESGPQMETLDGTKEGRLLKRIESFARNSSGQYIKEVFNYEIRVHLLSTNIYALSIRDLNQNETVTTKAVASDGNHVEEMVLRKDHRAVNGISASFPRFEISLKCLLRSQSGSSIPDLTPGPPTSRK